MFLAAALVLVVGTVPAAAQGPPTTAAPAPSADAEAAAAITVTPDTGLVDEQVVAVEVSGLYGGDFLRRRSRRSS